MYSTSDDSDLSWLIVGLTIGVIVVIVAVAYLLEAIFLARVLRKIGDDEWRAWVPIYNRWTLLEHGGQPGWWSLFSLIPYGGYVTMIFLAVASYNLGLRFSKVGAGWVILSAALPIVWLAIVGCDSVRYDGAVPFRFAPIGGKPRRVFQGA